jgi:predicted transcriptional regulator
MEDGYEKTANDFLELASEQRLAILSKMQDGPVKVSTVAKELEATVPEVYRNFERMVKADLIAKNPDGSYGITTIGKTLYSQVTLMGFLSGNKKYFKSHDFDQLPEKFIQRMGTLEQCNTVKGFVKVQEKWKEIYNDAEEYIYNVLFEVPYTQDLMELLVKKINSGVKLQSIFSESAVIPKERRQVFDKFGFKDLIQQGKIERKMKENVKTIVILNEKEAGVMFPTTGGDVDMSEGFFSTDTKFHESCLDYFEYSWKGSSPFREAKLKE